MELTGVDVAAYERVSKDESGVERSPEEQHDGHIETCERFGWRLQTPTYREVGSASKYQRKARAAFDRLIADLKAGRFTARVLLLYASNRGSRQMEEWLELINLCTKRDVVFWVEQYDRILDPRKPRDRKQLIDDASKAELDVAEMSQNIRRTTKASARKGLPHGRIPFGYRRIYDERTRKLLRQEPDPVEAPIVREMYDRVLAGHTLKAIARDLNARGLKRRGGGDWVPQNIALMLLREVYTGVRVHDPNRKSAYQPMTPEAKVTEGVWEPLVAKATFLGVKRILRDPGRRTNGRPGAVVHLLSGIAACGKCGELLRVNLKQKKYWRYVCITNGCVSIDKTELEDYAHERVQQYLEKLSEHLLVDEAIDGELDDVTAQLADARAERDETAALVRERRQAGKRTGTLATMVADLEDRIEELEQREQKLRTPSRLAGLITPGPTVRSEYPGIGFDAQRALARIVLTPTPVGTLGLGQLQVLQIGPGRRREPIQVRDRTRFFRPDS
ncbi:recombinase family protein [Amycolatopsis sp. NPDC051128]|uniref:recombinase family protein n=1 Tax=Amycolatopsis sp. NPDC051128 TaxID=3155412 RepID=UPI00343C680A